VVLLVLRRDEATLAPDHDFVLAEGDELLLAGCPAAGRALGTALVIDAAREYVATGRRVASSLIWRTLAPTPATDVVDAATARRD
jgi:voltage-gated potassium channel